MFIGTLKMNRAIQVVFGTLVVLFFLLAISDFTGNADIKVIAGFEGIICGLSAIYLSAAQVLNEVYGNEVLPIGAKKINKFLLLTTIICKKRISKPSNSNLGF